jgi:hypothetical protein
MCFRAALVLDFYFRGPHDGSARFASLLQRCSPQAGSRKQVNQTGFHSDEAAGTASRKRVPTMNMRGAA